MYLLFSLFLATSPSFVALPQTPGTEPLWADFDGDGLLDAYLFGSGSEDVLLLNTGAGGFVDATLEAGLMGLRSRFALLADVDADGIVDLVRVTASGTLQLRPGEGQARFGVALQADGLESACDLTRVAAFDLDADGDLDLAGRTTNGALLAFENLGQRVFAALHFAAPSVAIAAEPVIVETKSSDADVLPSNGAQRVDAVLGSRGSVSPGSSVSGFGGLAAIGSATASPSASSGPLTNPLPLQTSGFTAIALRDQGSSGAALRASSTPTFGMLFPLSNDFFIDSAGHVGIGTTSIANDVSLQVEGKVVFGANQTPNGFALATIGGGEDCETTGDYAVVSGGLSNSAGFLAAVAGGTDNTASGWVSTVGGGGFNTADYLYSTVTGGRYNTASGYSSAVGGGSGNVVDKDYATIPGGRNNVASGRGSFAAGQYAEALHDGAFVWADNSAAVFSSTAADQFLIQAAGGVGIGTPTPEAELHVRGTDLALPAGAVSLETLVAEDTNAILGLYSDGGGSYGSGVVLGEVVAGTFVNKWALVRRTGSNRNLEFTFGTNTTYNNNPTLFTFADEGVLLVGDDTAPTLRLAAGSILQNSTNLDIHADADLSLTSGGDISIQNDALHIEAGSHLVGIHTAAPQFDLHVNGSAGKPGGGLWAVASDARLKKNVVDLEGSLERLLELRGVTFEYRDPGAIGELKGVRTGMIAQEVQRVFPDWVEEANDGYLRMTIRGFSALTVEALRELRGEKDCEIDGLRAEVEELRESLAELRCSLASGRVAR